LHHKETKKLKNVVETKKTNKLKEKEEEQKVKDQSDVQFRRIKITSKKFDKKSECKSRNVIWKTLQNTEILKGMTFLFEALRCYP